MTQLSLAHPAPPPTRFERGIALAQERFEEITRVAPWIWSVPSAIGSEAGVYACNLKTGACAVLSAHPKHKEVSALLLGVPHR